MSVESDKPIIIEPKTDTSAALNISPTKNKKDKNADQSENYEFDPEHPFNGIINRLTKLCSGNPHTKGVIYITASSTAANHPSQVIDYNWTSHWVSSNQPDQWIKIDFKQLKFSIVGYSIKTYNYVSGGNHLKNWSLQVSANDNEWVDVDHHISDETLNGKSRVAYFTFRMPSSFRYIRLMQTGKTWCDSDMLSFTNIEFYGKFKPDPSLMNL